MLTKEDLKKGGPGLDGYAYQADVYCVSCAEVMIDALPKSEFTDLEAGDTEEVPVPIFFGEGDTAQHCAECGEYLYGPGEDEA